MKDFLSALGGALGALYATGYLVSAGHARVLGLPVHSTDPVSLLDAAWDFAIRGTVIVVLRSLESITWPRALMAALLVGTSVAAALSARATYIVKQAFHYLTARNRRLHSALLAIAVACLVLEIWHIAAHVVPTSAVTALLFNRGQRSPFQGASIKGFLESRWYAVQQDLIGDGSRSYTRNLSRRYVLHVIVAVTTFLASWSTWRQSRRHPPAPKWIRTCTATSMGVAAFLMAYTPLYYGALVKSYQYPVVNIVGTDKDVGGALADELKVALSHSRFLIETTGDNLYLFDASSGELHILAKTKVGMVKVIAEDFVFRK